MNVCGFLSVLGFQERMPDSPSPAPSLEDGRRPGSHPSSHRSSSVSSSPARTESSSDRIRTSPYYLPMQRIRLANCAFSSSSKQTHQTDQNQHRFCSSEPIRLCQMLCCVFSHHRVLTFRCRIEARFCGSIRVTCSSLYAHPHPQPHLPSPSDAPERTVHEPGPVGPLPQHLAWAQGGRPSPRYEPRSQEDAHRQRSDAAPDEVPYSNIV